MLSSNHMRLLLIILSPESDKRDKHMGYTPTDLLPTAEVQETIRLFDAYLEARTKAIETLQQQVHATRVEHRHSKNGKRDLNAGDLADVLFSEARIRLIDYVSGLDPIHQAQIMAMAYLGKMKTTPTDFLWNFYVRQAQGMNEGGALPSLLAGDSFSPRHIETCLSQFESPA